MNNKEVAHLWANRSRERVKGSSFYFEGDTIYSYGSHFPIARHYKGAVLFTTQGYSHTTSKHKSITRQACSHLTVFHVDNPMVEPGKDSVKAYGERIRETALSAARARRNVDFQLKELEALVDEANAFCGHFGFKTRFAMPDNLDELRAKAKASEERERKAKAQRQAKLEAECAEKIAAWLNGEAVTIPHQISKTYLRAGFGEWPDDRVMETSRGAKVPLSEAEKAFRFVELMRQRGGWNRNGEQFKVGDYQIDAVNEQGVIAGCHRITWEEVERFAKTQGWL